VNGKHSKKHHVMPHRVSHSPDVSSDADLLAAMRRHDTVAWGVFAARYRPILEAYARKNKIPTSEWAACIDDLLADEALRLSQPDVVAPDHLAAYLIRAVRHRYLYIKRSASCRDRNYSAASEDRAGESVISSACSEDALRSSAGPDASPIGISGALRRLAGDLRAGLTDEEESLLIWASEGVPRRRIAEWVGMSHEACAKRIWRLCRRLRLECTKRSGLYSLRDQAEIERFLRRAKAGSERTHGATRAAPPAWNPR
jgi:hypothetical protein